MERYGYVWTTDANVLKDIPGVTYIPNFLTKEEQVKAIATLESHEFKTVVHRRQQFYGETYYHKSHNLKEIQPSDTKEGADFIDLTELQFIIDKMVESGIIETKDQNYCSSNVCDSSSGPSPNKSSRLTYPTQCLVNEYIGNMGIGPHFDDFDAFGPYIATLSLVGPILMKLSLPEFPVNKCKNILKHTSILLEPGSLFVMEKDCRYKWLHEIRKKPKVVKLPDESFVIRDDSFKRLSLTFRNLLSGRKRNTKDGEWCGVEKINIWQQKD